MAVTLELEEEERQLVLMALAQLAVRRPGWDYILNHIALRIDNHIGLPETPTIDQAQEGSVESRGEMFDQFKEMHLQEFKAHHESAVRAGS